MATSLIQKTRLEELIALGAVVEAVSSFRNSFTTVRESGSSMCMVLGVYTTRAVWLA